MTPTPQVPTPETTPTSPGDSATIRAAIAGHLRAARRRAGLTQAELAQAAGMSQAAIARAEAGDHPVAVDRLDALADALDVTIFDLLGGPR